jgi:hypothetical protein
MRKSDPPADGLNGSPPPDPLTIGVAGIVATPLKPWIPEKDVWTLKGMPPMGMSPAAVCAVTEGERCQCTTRGGRDRKDPPLAVP